MGEVTGIQWTHHTFNPWIGCTKVHAGCTNCYAEKLATSRLGVAWGANAERRVTAESTWRQPLRWARAAAKAGERRRVFCASLADVLDERAPVDAQARLWGLIRETAGSLDWLLLTKRPERWQLIPEDVRPLVWLGTSIADQKTADEFVPRLLDAEGFAVRFLSAEPLVGPVDIASWLEVWGIGEKDGSTRIGGIDWVIVGGESGHGARPFNIAWARSLRDQCQAAGVACFVKQLGALTQMGPTIQVAQYAKETPFARWCDKKGGDWSEWPADIRVREFPGVRT